MFLLVQCVVLAITASQNNSLNTTNSTSPSSNTSSTGYTNDTTTTQEPTQTTSVGTTLVPNATTTTQGQNGSNTTNTTQEPTPEAPAQEELVDLLYNFNFDAASCEVAGLQDALKKLTSESILEITGLENPNSDVAQCGSIHIVKSYKVDEAKLAEVQGAGVQDAIETSLRAAIAADPALAGLDLSFVLAVLVANDDVACPLPLPLHAKTTFLLEIAGGENVCLVIECDAGYNDVDNVCELTTRGISPRSGLSGGEIAGVVMGSVVAVALVALVVSFATQSAVVAKPTNEPVEA